MQLSYNLPKFHHLFSSSFENNLELISFLNNNINSNKWTIYSDYCFTPNNEKHHIAIAFTIFPYQDTFWIKSFNSLINSTHKKDIKKSTLSENFYKFLKCINNLPIFTFALIMDKNFNPYKIKGKNSKDYFIDRYDSLNRYYKNQLFLNSNDLQIKSAIKKSKEYLNALNNKPNTNLNLLGQMDLCATIISTLFKTISDHTNHENKILWCSDRDSILDYMSKKNEQPIIFDMIFHDFQLSTKNKNQQLVFFHKQNTDLDNFIRIPDFIAGTLSDMNLTKVSNKKFIPILHECMTNNKKIRVQKLIANDGFFELKDLIFEPILTNIDWNAIDWNQLKASG